MEVFININRSSVGLEADIIESVQTKEQTPSEGSYIATNAEKHRFMNDRKCWCDVKTH